MTPEQKIELEYLIDLLREASKWNVDQGDDALRLEVDLRINNILNGENPTDAEPDNLTAEDEALTGSDYQALEAQKLDEYIEKKRAQNRKAKEKWKKDKVRVVLDGKPVWKSRSECHQEKRFPDQPDSTLFRWVWDGPVATDEK